METSAPTGNGGQKSGAAARLEQQNTTVSKRIQEVSAACEPWRAERAAQLEAKARAPQVAATRRRWYFTRAAGLRRTIADKIEDCGQQVATLAHLETGEVIQRPIGCACRLCPACQKRKGKRVFARLAKGLRQLAQAERARKREAVLLTLTVRTSGTLADRARLLRAAWPNFRASWRANYKWTFKFLRFEEATAGKTGAGHVHWHLLAFLPTHALSYRKGLLQKWWAKACRAARAKLGLSPDDQGQNLDIGKPSTGRAVGAIAAYAGKIFRYIAKGAGHLAELAPEVCAAYLDATYGMRVFACSVGVLVAVRAAEWQIISITRAEVDPEAPQSEQSSARGPPV